MRVRATQATPNPDAIKLMLDQSQAGGIRSYRAGSGDSPRGDALALALLSIEGVTGVLIHEAFITLTREKGRDFKPIIAAARLAVEQAEPRDAQPAHRRPGSSP